MGRPRKIERPAAKHLQLPEMLTIRVDLLLFSEVEGRVPFGAWSEYVAGLIREDLRLREKRAKVAGLALACPPLSADLAEPSP